MVLKQDDFDSEEIAAAALLAGDVAVLPTDTIYGFSAVAGERGKRAIQNLKGRGDEKPFIELIATPEDLKKISDTQVPQELLDLWPAPLTIIVEKKDGSGTVGVRCPKDAWLRSVIEKVGSPIYSTSVNESGKAPLTSAREIIRKWRKKVPLIVDAGDCEESKPSTIVKVVPDGSGWELQVLRQGQVSLDFLEETD